MLFAAGLLTAVGQVLLKHLVSGNGIDITAAIWFHAGRLPAARTLASAVLSILLVGMGTSLGREGAPKQTGAVIANAMSDRAKLSDDARRLLVACGAGSGMAAAYGVPLGGALFALEVLRGELALRLVLPALVTSLIATGVSWAFLPDAPTYLIPGYAGSASSAAWAVLAGPVIGLASVLYVRAVAWADHHRPKGRWRIVAPVAALTLLGAASIPFPQLLGNGRDVAELAFTGKIAPLLLLALVLLKPAASLGAGAFLAATTQGPISAVVLMMELTGHARSFMVPMLLAVAIATLVARTIEPRSVYDARLGDAEIHERQRQRDRISGST